MTTTNYLETEYIRLRAAEPEDLEVMYILENDSTLWEMGCTNAPYSRHLLREYLQNTTGDIFTDKQLRLMIERRADKQVVGCIDLTSFDPLNSRAEVGIAILAPYRRQGYAGTALELLCQYAFQFLHLHQLNAIVPEGNKASISLFLKQDFAIFPEPIKDWLKAPDGTYKDAYLLQRIDRDQLVIVDITY